MSRGTYLARALNMQYNIIKSIHSLTRFYMREKYATCAVDRACSVLYGASDMLHTRSAGRVAFRPLLQNTDMCARPGM